MRRDHFTVQTQHVEAGDEPPTLHVEYDGPSETLTRQLTDDDGALYGGEDVDAAFRLQNSLEDSAATGVFSLAHRITGEYLLEVNVDAETILSLVDAARTAASDDPEYRLHIEREDGDPVVHELDSLLVYDVDGGLLRQQSLIPSGVEL